MSEEKRLGELSDNIASDGIGAIGSSFVETDLNEVRSACSRVTREVKKRVVGCDDVIEYLLVSLIAQGHILMEGVPGIAKTTIANSFAHATGCDFSRIQFVADLLPSDIVGTYIYNARTAEFVLRKGPVFTNIVLADEINRAPPKTQAALLESMEERQVSIEGETYQIPPPFIVIATQNPVEREGIYSLPGAQLDRFLMRIFIGYSSKKDEIKIVRFIERDLADGIEVEQVLDPSYIVTLQQVANDVYISDDILEYITDLVEFTRDEDADHIMLGTSPRASIGLMKASKVRALINGRDYVIPDDVKRLVEPIFNHRIMLTPEAELQGFTNFDIVRDVLKSIAAI